MLTYGWTVPAFSRAVNTPLYHAHVDEKTNDETEWRMEVLKRLPTLKKLDGKDVTDDELEAAVNS